MNVIDLVGCNVYDDDNNIIGFVKKDKEGIFIEYDDGTIFRMKNIILCDEKNAELHNLN